MPSLIWLESPFMSLEDVYSDVDALDTRNLTILICQFM